MKKGIYFTFILIAFFSTILFFNIYRKEVSTKVNSHKLLSVAYDKSKVCEKQTLELNNLEASCMLYNPVMENYINQSDAIIVGDVQDIKYYEYQGFPWSKLTVKVDETVRGDIEAGESINVYVMEGYQYIDKEKTELIEVCGDGMGLHKKGEQIILGINEENGDSVFEKGSYRRTCSCFSEYRFNSNRKKYHIYEGEKEQLLGKREIKQRIKEICR